MKLELADISTNESKRLNGFKVLGFIPFHLKFITTKTHIQLCKVRAQMHELKQGKELIAEDFYDAELQEKLIPLINNYCIIALENNRPFGWMIRPFLRRKIERCAHSHILNLYFTIFKLNEPAFFLHYYKMMMMKDNTLLKEVTP